MRSRLQRINQAKRAKQIIFWMVFVTTFTLVFKLIGQHNTPKTIKIQDSQPTPTPKIETKKPIEIIQEIKAVEPIEDDFKKSDELVGNAVDEFFTSNGQRSEVRMIMHCLLNRESKHNVSKGKGDGGLAQGPLQYHQETWVGYRKIMIKKGFATEIDSPYNLKEAIRTTVWAILDGRATAWGPILRWQNKRYVEATCPSPSFY